MDSYTDHDGYVDMGGYSIQVTEPVDMGGYTIYEPVRDKHVSIDNKGNHRVIDDEVAPSKDELYW
jgi:hypothetical protein